MIHKMRVVRALALLPALLAVAVLPACGAGAGAEGGGGGSGAADLSVAIVEPATGARVAPSFTVKLDTGVPLGPTESGRHHVHVYLDGDEDDYVIAEADTVQVIDAPPGRHVLHASLRNANHSPAGAETEISVEVAAGGGGGASEAPDDPYRY